MPIIHANVISSIQVLIANTEEFGEMCNLTVSHVPAMLLLSFMFSQQDEMEALSALPPNGHLTPELGDMVHALWNDKGIQKTYDNRAKFQLNDSTD